ncbi:MAG: hypothetical protein ACR2ML_10910, partial [Solirubrobacteraceae bacterium]
MRLGPATLLVLGVLAAAACGAVATENGPSVGPPPASSARTDRWTALRPAPLKRTEVAAARIGEAIYVVGGYVPPNGATTAAV